MASKNEDVASKHSDNGNKPQGGGRRRGHDKSQSGQKHHEEGAAKKKHPGQSSSRQGNRGRGHSGGKDSSQPHGHHDKHRSEQQQQQSGGSASSVKNSWPREGGGVHSRQQGRGHPHRASNLASNRPMEQGRRGQPGRPQDRSRAYRPQQGSSKNSDSSEHMCTPLDSGIGMDGGSSPEAATESEHTAAGLMYSADGEQELLVPQANSSTSLSEQGTDLALTNLCNHVSSSQDSKTMANERAGEALEQPVEARLLYDREMLLSMKECVQSLLKPHGLDKIPAELLKTSNRHSGDGWESHHGDMELGEDGKAKHPTTLSLIREHDMKQMTRVSLSPQRRSFGSGCSWRDQFSGLNRQSSAASTDSAAIVDQEDAEQQHGTATHQLGLHSYPHGPPPSPHGHTHHPTRVIDHVPYRSRQSHGDLSHHWRDNQPQVTQEDDQEPEWMAFGPSDRSEFIELKGLDEHEARKEADRQAQSRDDGTSDSFEKEELKSFDNTNPVSEEPPVSAQSTQDESKESVSPAVVEKFASCPSPKDQFVLDGFDFSTGLSICHTLESDSDDEPPKKTSMSNSEQLSSALMKVLGVGTDNRDVAPAPCGKVKAVTLDEIEAPLTKHDDDGDATAYRKLLAVLQSSGAMQDEVAAPETGPHSLGSFHGSRMSIPMGSTPAVPAPIGPPSKSGPVPGRMLYHGASSVERDSGMALAASLQLSAQHSVRAQSLERQRLLYSHPLPPHSHQTSLASSSDLTGTKAARWSMAGQQWSTLPSSSASSHTYYPQQPSPMATGRMALGQQHLGGNSSWVTEMERKRVAELRHMQQYQEYQQSRQHPAIFNRKLPSSPSNVQVPSNLSLLPTSVLRQIHSSKPSQSPSDMSPAQQVVLPHTLPHSGRRPDHEVTQRTNQNSALMSGMHLQTEAQASLHPSSMMPTSRGMYHSSSAYGGMVPHSLRSGAYTMQVDPTMAQAGYLGSSSPSFLSQQLRMGVATVKQSPY